MSFLIWSSIFCLFLQSFVDASPSSALTWHLPLLGLPVPAASTPTNIRFVRRPSSSINLSGRLPSLAIIVTQNNLLGAINPKNGNIVWRFLLPKSDPIIHYVVDLDNRNLALISGGRIVTLRLLALSDGRLIWSKSLGDINLKPQSDDLPGRDCDLVFTADQHSDHSNFPDVVLMVHRSQVLRLSGHEGQIRWSWSSADSSWNILRVFKQHSPDQINLLLSKIDSASIYTIHVQSLSSTTGIAHDQRPRSNSKCVKSNDSPIVLSVPTDSSHSVLAGSAVICVDPEGHIMSALVPESSPTAPLKISTYSILKHNHPTLQDFELATHGVFIAKLFDGSAIVFNVTSEGLLKSLWSFDPTDLPTTYAGSVDRNGLPYVSKVNFMPSLGLASLEVLSLTPTERTPEGMIVGSTFAYDFAENGNIVAVSIEVLQVINYTPISRVLMVTDMGDIQLWQGEVLQWERHEDLSLPTSITIHQSNGIDGSLLITDPTDIPRYIFVKSKALFSSLLTFTPMKADDFNRPHTNDFVWLVGSATGRLFAIVRDERGEANILWRRNLMLPGMVGSTSTLKWIAVKIETIQSSQSSRAIVVIEKNQIRNTLKIGLLDGKILANSTASEMHDERQNILLPKKKILLAKHDQDVGASPARFLGDRGALFKYLNPSLGVYLNDEFDQKIIEVIDQSSGALIWAFEFMKNQVDLNSFHAALTENWLVLVSRENHNDAPSTRIHSIEWFMSSKSDVRVDGSKANITSSVRSYIVPFDIKALSFTKSRLGVTSRALLVINDMDQIISIPRRLLDTRRPYKKPTSQELEEMLVMYDPFIPTDPKTVITGIRPVKDLKKVFSFPTEFESTSAVIGVGLDLFASSVAPSSTFDMLGSDFNKAQLILTCTGLLISTLILRPIVKNKQLKRQWYS